jgi:hypothetical protein
VRQLVREAEGKVGAVAEVIRCQCCEAGFCLAKFAYSVHVECGHQHGVAEQAGVMDLQWRAAR